jgi:hypothetical protein
VHRMIISETAGNKIEPLFYYIKNLIKIQFIILYRPWAKKRMNFL